MKQLISWCCAAFACLFPFFSASGQQLPDALWIFGEDNVVNFSSGSPVISSLPNTGGGPPYRNYYFSGAACDPTGAPLFWGKLFNNVNTNQFILYDRTGQAMPNGVLLTSGSGRATPVIVPDPADTNRYYFCYLRNGTLRYSLVDLRLHGGLGDVVTTQKDILLGAAGSLADRKLLAVPGCAGIWLVVRSRVHNEYYSYAIDRNGVAAVPVVSNCGLLPLKSYGELTEYSGVLSAAQGGGKLVAACGTSTPDPQIPGRRIRSGGLELYDFDRCSGRISAPVLLDTGYYYGAAFSPDNSKLYATRIFERTLYQFDLSLPDLAAVAASKTLVLTNPSYGTNGEENYLLGDIKAARDGRMYLGNNKCADYPFTNALHVIRNPNVAGTGCNPLLSGFPLPAGTGSCTGLNLPAAMVTAGRQDTVYEPALRVTACFRSELLLAPDTLGSCFRWADGLTAPARLVTSDSSYHVRYTDQNCRLHIANYQVTFRPFQPVMGATYACPGSNAGAAFIVPRSGDTSVFTYRWQDAAGHLLQTRTGRLGDTLRGLDTGRYSVQVTAAGGCDTVFELQILAIPQPVASALVDTMVCSGVPVTFTSTSAAPLTRWLFGYGDVVAGRTTSRAFGPAGDYQVLQVVQNAEGCTDTLVHQVGVLGLDLALTANKITVGVGELVSLHVRANEPFRTIAWTPTALFPQPEFLDQQVRVDSTTLFKVTGVSDFGCVDSAELEIIIDPVVFVPSAFSPNGDGRNDRFRLHSIGDGIFVRHIAVYNRWGHKYGKGTVMRQMKAGMEQPLERLVMWGFIFIRWMQKPGVDKYCTAREMLV